MRWWDNPSYATHIHSFGVAVWLGMVPLALWAGWLDSVQFVSALSIAALAIGHWSAREAATAQRDLEAQLERMEGTLDELVDCGHGPKATPHP